MKYSKDGLVLFNPETHSYHLGERILEGVTSYIGRHKNKFDADTIAEKYAIKHGLKKEDVLKQWSDKAKKSCDNGTAVHTVFENFCNTGLISLDNPTEKESQAIKFISDFFLSNRLTPVECEVIVYNNYLASQIDLIAKNKNNDHFIFDWKTNEKIDKCSFNDKRMLEPYSKYPDCSYYHYSLQTCIYKNLCKDYDIKDLFIVHIDIDKYNILKPEKIQLPNNLFN